MQVISNSVIFNMYEMTVDEAKRSTFNEVGKRNMVTSLAIENGTLGMYSTTNEAGHHLVFELYRDQDAYQKHLASSQYQDFRQVAADAVTDQRQIKLVPEFLSEQDVSLNATTDNQMWINVVRFQVKDGQGDAFKEILLPYLEKAMETETEILVCYVAQVANHPGEWITFQVFQNDGTFNKYVASDGFKRVQDQLAPLIEKREIEPLDGLVLINQGHY